MLIVRMTFSRAMACAGNQPRETLWSSMKLHGKSRMVLLNDKDVSPNACELDSASLHYKLLMVKLPKMLKPVTREEETNKSTHGISRGDWGGRVSKDWQWDPGRPARCIKREVSEIQEYMGINNHVTCRKRESERSIVAMKRGNSRGAKGPYFSHVSTNRVRTA
jgi:hypothetical protein